MLDRGIRASLSFARDATPPGPALLDEIAAMIPHGDDFDAPASTYAQDAVICIHAAVRCCGPDACDPRWIEYALEPIATAISMRNEREGPEVDRPTIAAALRFCREAISALEARSRSTRSCSTICSLDPRR